MPVDTTDEVVFTSSDENVVVVDEFGLITAVGTGEASIIVTCGDVIVECPVLCGEKEVPTDPTEEPTDPTDPTEPTEEPENFVLKLKSKDFTLKKAGATYKLYDGEVDASDITWTSDNEEVATINDGVVTAVGNGRTRVYGEYGDQKVSCWVSIKLPEEEVTEPTEPEETEPEVTEPEETGSYRLLVNGRVSRYGDEYNAEVTIAIDEEFRLTVEDEAGVRQDVTWKVSKDGICSINGRTITGESKGKVTLTATIGDKTFKCVIIVK